MIVAVNHPPAAATLGDSAASMRADLDGKPIALSDVGRHYCEDFTAPAIHCYSTKSALETAAAPLAAAATNYVVVFEFTTYAGNYMYMSQDYTVLATIGWNDRISSFMALNSESGHFFTDWFYGATTWGFCCNQQVPGLGAYDNTFSSVHRL